jgi:hypothetical protein
MLIDDTMEYLFMVAHLGEFLRDMGYSVTESHQSSAPTAPGIRTRTATRRTTSGSARSKRPASTGRRTVFSRKAASREPLRTAPIRKPISTLSCKQPSACVPRSLENQRGLFSASVKRYMKADESGSE